MIMRIFSTISSNVQSKENSANNKKHNTGLLIKDNNSATINAVYRIL